MNPDPNPPVLAPILKALHTTFTPALLKGVFKNVAGAAKSTGHCYAASEALYHAMGGRSAGITPQFLVVGGVPHWFLKLESGQVIDPTFDQFSDPVDYSAAKGKGFLTIRPSKRASTMLSACGWVPGSLKNLCVAIDLKNCNSKAPESRTDNKSAIKRVPLR